MTSDPSQAHSELLWKPETWCVNFEQGDMSVPKTRTPLRGAHVLGEPTQPHLSSVLYGLMCTSHLQ